MGVEDCVCVPRVRVGIDDCVFLPRGESGVQRRDESTPCTMKQWQIEWLRFS